MYQLTNVKTQDLSKVTVENQDKILELTGRKLELTTAYEVIKKETKGFTVEVEKAHQADQLFAELLLKNGIELEGIPAQKGKHLKLKEQERTRALDLLELELQLAAGDA